MKTMSLKEEQRCDVRNAKKLWLSYIGISGAQKSVRISKKEALAMIRDREIVITVTTMPDEYLIRIIEGGSK